jgi:hypothetical protein
LSAVAGIPVGSRAMAQRKVVRIDEHEQKKPEVNITVTMLKQEMQMIPIHWDYFAFSSRIFSNPEKR